MSFDMVWLYKQGLEVVGSDICPECGPMFIEANPDLGVQSKEVTLKNGKSAMLFEVSFMIYILPRKLIPS